MWKRCAPELTHVQKASETTDWHLQFDLEGATLLQRNCDDKVALNSDTSCIAVQTEVALQKIQSEQDIEPHVGMVLIWFKKIRFHVTCVVHIKQQDLSHI